MSGENGGGRAPGATSLGLALRQEEVTALPDLPVQRVTIDDIVTAVFELIPEQYVDGMSNAQLCRQWGLQEGKVRGIIKRAGVHEKRKPGPSLAKECGKGHDQSLHRKVRRVKGVVVGSFCGQCKRDRERGRW